MKWQDVLADNTLKNLPYKIELNEYGKIEMSPASFIHSLLQGEIAKRLGNLIKGRVFTELAIQTSKGIRVPDVAWGSTEYVQQHIKETFASTAPGICVEIISPSNSQEEMEAKVALFIEAGAKEVWLVSEDGKVTYFDASGQIYFSSFKVNLDKLI